MGKGYILAITTAIVLVVMVLYLQNFSAKKDADLSSIAQTLVSEKVAHTWRDISNDLFMTTAVIVDTYETTVMLNDSLPAPFDVSEVLRLYGMFLAQYYITPDLSVEFLSPGGSPLNISDLPPKITILPMNIEYYYPSWAKRELFLTSPIENFSAITRIDMHINISNAAIDCSPINPLNPTPCDFVNPYADCKDNTLYRLYLNLSFSDYMGHYFALPETCFDVEKKSTENLDVANESSNYYIKAQIGPLPTVINVQLQNTYVNTSTSIILNTSDFYISHLSKLKVSAVDYNTSRVDWA